MIYSKWYYGHLITSDNNKIDFDEGGSELTATIRPGSYTLEEFADELASQMTATGGQTYTTSVNRAARLITLSATSNFTLRVSTGTHAGTTAYLLAGFTGSNRTGDNEYTGDTESGEEFAPQFPLQSLSDFSEQREYIDSSVNMAASGYVEVVSFGSIRRMDCEIKFQTNVAQTNLLIKNDASGFQNFKDFMEYAIKKGRMEFMLDQSDPDSFVNCILDKTDKSQNGTAYELKRMNSMKLWDYFESGSLSFREVF
jgi:hypothetical protein